MNDRDEEKYEGHEESEYHFSEDEDTGDEHHAEGVEPTVRIEEARMNMRDSGKSKRMIIGAVIFFALVGVVYKIFVPSPSTSATDIIAPQQVAQDVASKITAPEMKPSAPVTAAVKPTAPTAAPAAPTTAATQVASAPPTMPTMPAVMTIPQPGAAMPSSPAVPVAQTTQAAPVIPTATDPNSPLIVVPPSNVAMVPPMSQTAVANMASLDNATEKAMNDMQAAYTQKMNEYSAQNKALQDQVQTLNTRIGTLESELNQLMQTLLRQQGANVPTNANGPAVPMQSSQTEPKTSYNVQAIIPGRAWLKADNGETVTVAEGDVIRDLGRITKIDPYDGVVQINTGNKVVSLSYGNGG